MNKTFIKIQQEFSIIILDSSDNQGHPICNVRCSELHPSGRWKKQDPDQSQNLLP